jgi:HK97 family phage major capsid protein
MTTRKLPDDLKPGTTGERFLRIDAQRDGAIDEAARTVTLAFASETPVQRWWGNEILDLSPGAMDTDRLRSGGAVLMDHDVTDQVGVIESVQIGADRVARAVVRFGKSARASEVFQDVVDGIRQNVSVGYRILEAVLETISDDDDDTYRVTRWQPYEISMVSVPADPSVGVGRSATDHPMHPETRTMNPEATQAAQAPAAAAPVIDTARLTADAQRSGAETERKRIADITAGADQLAKYDGVREIASEAIRSGWTMDQFRAKALEKVTTAPQPGANIGMTERDIKRYSVVRALNALANPTDAGARESAAFEYEVSRAAADKQGRGVKGLLVPYDVLSARADDLVVGTAGKGGNLVATNLLTGSFIDLLRNKMVINRLGAQFLTGLVGNIAVPRQSGGATFYWVGESGSATSSNQTFDQVPMSPQTGCAKTQISRKLLLQSSLDVEGFVRNDLATVMGLGIQQAAINGSGTAPTPLGILNVSGIGSVVGGTNGAVPSWANIVALETAVAVANADVGTLGYLTNAAVRGKLKSIQKFTTNPGGDAIWEKGDTPLNGYQAAVTNAVPSNGTEGTGTNLSSIIFGNFADLIIGMWGGLELQVDPYSSGDTGSVIVRAFQDVDTAVRHAESFSAMKDAITA